MTVGGGFESNDELRRVSTSSGESRRVAAERVGGKSVAAGGGVSKRVVGARKECGKAVRE